MVYSLTMAYTLVNINLLMYSYISESTFNWGGYEVIYTDIKTIQGCFELTVSTSYNTVKPL